MTWAICDQTGLSPEPRRCNRRADSALLEHRKAVVARDVESAASAHRSASSLHPALMSPQSGCRPKARIPAPGRDGAEPRHYRPRVQMTAAKILVGSDYPAHAHRSGSVRGRGEKGRVRRVRPPEECLLSAQPCHCWTLWRRSLHNPLCRLSLSCVAGPRFVEFTTYALASRLRVNWMEPRVRRRRGLALINEATRKRITGTAGREHRAAGTATRRSTGRSGHPGISA
jgi:hypothetical protein